MTESRFLKRVIQHPTDPLATSDSATPESTQGAGPTTESTSIIHDAGDVLAPDALRDLQVLILGRDAEIFLNERTVSLIQTWVARDGGSLVCSRGAPLSQIDQQLGRLLPVKWSPGHATRSRMELTTMGRDLRWLAGFGGDSVDALSAMPSLALSTHPEQRPGLTNVLAAGTGGQSDDETPMISFQPYGTGRTVVIEGAGMWRWALLAPENAARGEVYGLLWRSLMRWLVSRTGLLPGQDAALQPDKILFGTNEHATATLLLRQESSQPLPKLVLTDSTGNSSEFAPSRLDRILACFASTWACWPRGVIAFRRSPRQLVCWPRRHLMSASRGSNDLNWMRERT